MNNLDNRPGRTQPAASKPARRLLLPGAVLLLLAGPLQAQHYKYLQHGMMPHRHDQLLIKPLQNPLSANAGKTDDAVYRKRGLRGFIGGMGGPIRMKEARYTQRKFIYGLEFKFSYRPFEAIPLSIGVSGGGITIGKEDHTAEMQAVQIQTGPGQPVGWVTVPVTVSLKNSFIMVGLNLRAWFPDKYMPPALKFMHPFVEMAAGRMYSDTSVDIYDKDDKGLYGGSMENGKVATWPVAAGLGFFVGNELDCELKFTWLNTGRISYYERTDVLNWDFRITGDNLTFDNPPPVVTSPLKVLLINVGFNWRFRLFQGSAEQAE